MDVDILTEMENFLSDKEASEILREIRELSDVEDAEFVEETSGLKVITKDNQFLDVMSAAVNICNRVADGLELSFARFAV